MAGWRDMERQVDKIVGHAFGERVRLTFMKDGRSDPSRPQVTIMAVLHTGGDDSFNVGSGYRSRVSAGAAELFLDRSIYSGPIPAARDIVRAMDRAGQPRFEVKSISDRYSNLLVLSLNQA